MPPHFYVPPWRSQRAAPPSKGQSVCEAGDTMADKVISSVSYRGHILCCVAVVFVCFLLCTLNLYMLSSVRSVLRRLEMRPDSVFRPIGSPASDPDFLLLDPRDLDNAWTTQTGRLLVPRGQIDSDQDGDDDFQQMKAQLMEQQSHIEGLHDTLVDQFRAHGELQRSQQELLREHGLLHREKLTAAEEHQRELAQRELKLLKQRQKVLQKDSKHKEEVRRYQEQIDQLNRLLAENFTLSASPTPEEPGVVENGTVLATMAETKSPLQSNGTTSNGETLDTVVEIAAQQGLAPPPTVETTAPQQAEYSDPPAQIVFHPLGHILSAVFGPNPGDFFFPAVMSREEVPVDQEHHVVNRVLADGVGGEEMKMEEEVAPEPMREKRDLHAERRAERRAALQERLQRRRRRHELPTREDNGLPLMIADGGFVRLPESSITCPLYVDPDEERKSRPGERAFIRNRRAHRHGQ